MLLALLSLAVLVALSVPVGFALARVVDEAGQLRMELERARRLRPLLAEVGSGTHRLRLALARRSPR